MLWNERMLKANLFHLHFFASLLFWAAHGCSSLCTQNTDVVHRFPSALLSVFSGISEIYFQTVWSWGHEWCSNVCFCFDVASKEIITDREVRLTCRPWLLAVKWSDMPQKRFPNNVCSCCHCMGIFLDPCGQELNSIITLL